MAFRVVVLAGVVLAVDFDPATLVVVAVLAGVLSALLAGVFVSALALGVLGVAGALISVLGADSFAGVPPGREERLSTPIAVATIRTRATSGV